MTRTTNARVAGFTFLFYIASGMASLALAARPHATDVLSVCTALSALVLGVTLYSLTREQDSDLALLALVCRVIEAMPGTGQGMGAIFFAVGSTLFCFLLLRGRMIPGPLALSRRMALPPASSWMSMPVPPDALPCFVKSETLPSFFKRTRA